MKAYDETAALRAWGEFRQQCRDRDAVTIRLTSAPRAMSSGAGDAGGYLVLPATVADAVEVARSTAAMRRVSTIVRDDSGADGGEADKLNIVTVNPGLGDAAEGEFLAESTAPTEADLSFGVLALGKTVFSSKRVFVPLSLFDDGGERALASLVGAFAARISRRENRAFTVGTGAGPQGVYGAATVTVTTASSSGVLYSELCSLIGSLAPEYFEDQDNPPRFMMSPGTYSALLTYSKDGQGRPLVPLISDDGRLANFEIVLNAHAPSIAAGATPILFGVFSNYVVRDAGDFRFVKSIEAANAVERRMALCYATSRSDGGLLVPDSARPPIVGLQMKTP